MWNKHSAILARQDLTTNSSEGTNSAIKISVSRNANIWNIMKQIKNEDGLVALKLRDAAIGYNPESGKKRTKTREQRSIDLYYLVSNYSNSTTKEFMEFVKDFFNDSLEFVELNIYA